MSNATHLASPLTTTSDRETADRTLLHGRLSDDALDVMLLATAETIRLDIPADCLAGVRDNLRAVLAVAATLAEPETPCSQVMELAPVYRA